MRGKDIPNMPSSALRRLLDGDAQWGSLAIQPDRFGTRYFLIVYPPGITAGERRRIRIWRGWPIWGAMLWIFSEIALTRHLDPWYALAVSTGVLLAAGATAFVMAGEARNRVRTTRATLIRGDYDPISRAACSRMHELADRLREADARRSRGLMEPAEFEMTWWQVYDELAATAPTSVAGSSSGSNQ